MTTLPLLDHPVVLGGAEAMAEECILTCCDVDGAPRACNRESAAFRAVTNVHAILLCDLSRPASRDWWVRWLIAHGCAAYDARWAAEHARLSGFEREWTDKNWPKVQADDHAAIRRDFNAFRDEINGLVAAITWATQPAATAPTPESPSSVPASS